MNSAERNDHLITSVGQGRLAAALILVVVVDVAVERDSDVLSHLLVLPLIFPFVGT